MADDGRWAVGTDAWHVGRDSRESEIVAIRERAARLRREVCDAIHECAVSGHARGIADDLRRAVDEYDAAEEVDGG